MNCEAVAWALALDLKPSSAKWVLVAIASEIKDGVLQASQAEIARIVGMTDRSVRSALKMLEERGYIKRTPNPGRGAGRMADTISLGQPEARQPEKSSAGKITQPENPASGKRNRTNRKSMPHQPEGISAEQAETVAAEAVDNCGGAHKGTPARAETPTLNNTTSELNPEREELAATAARDSAPSLLNGTAKGMLAHDLARNLIRIVGSPSLDPRSHRLFVTCGEIRAWIDEGADFDSDIVPTVADLCARKGGRPIQSFKYFGGAVRDAALTRIAIAERKLNKITLEEANAHAERTGSKQHSYASAGRRRARSVETEILMRDLAGDPPDVHAGRLDFTAGK